jgi:hypothetical protein
MMNHIKIKERILILLKEQKINLIVQEIFLKLIKIV